MITKELGLVNLVSSLIELVKPDYHLLANEVINKARQPKNKRWTVAAQRGG